MSRARIHVWISGLILMLGFQGGCGLFQPRDPRPGGGVTVRCAPLNSPDSLVLNILSHYADKVSVSCYSDMLDTSFVFHPDVTDSNEIPAGDSSYVGWNSRVETRDAKAIAADASFHVAVFDSEYAARVISADSRTQTRFYPYHLIIKASSIPADSVFRGRADITFFQGLGGQWHITSWVDKRDGSGARTWGYLRRVYRVGF